MGNKNDRPRRKSVLVANDTPSKPNVVLTENESNETIEPIIPFEFEVLPRDISNYLINNVRKHCILIFNDSVLVFAN